MNVGPAVGPFIGFGVGYALGRMGIGPATAGIVGTGISIGWSVVGPRAVVGATVSAAKALYVTPAGPMAAAVVVPVAVGAAASYAIAGKEGIDDYKEFITEPLKMPGRVIESLVLIQEHTNTNRAVADNAAGLPAGQNIYGSHRTREEQWRSTGSYAGDEGTVAWW
jgi:hypothetical protein